MNTENAGSNTLTKKKSWIWIVIGVVCALLLITIIVVVIVVLHKKDEETDSETSEHEMNEETVIQPETTTEGVTIDNPLFTTSNFDSDDPFRGDYQESYGKFNKLFCGHFCIYLNHSTNSYKNV